MGPAFHFNGSAADPCRTSAVRTLPKCLETDSTVGTAVYLLCAWSVAGFMSLVERWTYVPGLLRRGAVP